MSECPYTVADFEREAAYFERSGNVVVPMLRAAARLRAQVDQQAQEIRAAACPSRADLERALELARRAGELAPSSGIWAFGASERRWAEARRLAGLDVGGGSLPNTTNKAGLAASAEPLLSRLPTPSTTDLEQALSEARCSGILAARAQANPSTHTGAGQHEWAEARRLAGLGERRDETKGWDV